MGAVYRAKFLHDLINMNFDRLFGNEETVRNFPVSVAVCNASKNLDLTLRQVFIAKMFGNAICDERRNTLLSGMHSPDCFDELLVRHALQQVCPSAALQSSLNFHISFE